MKPFKNVTRDGNERAIRKGRVVPEGDINLAYVRSPELSPKENVVVVDTSRIVEDNVISSGGCKLYYANPIGVLVDKDDNAVISDQYPTITDVFSIDEDFSITPGNEYTNESILPYRHVSRYFHLDHVGLTLGDDEINYEHDAIKIVDSQGNEYSNYRIRITPAYVPGFDEDNLTNTGSSFPASTWAYRVFAYIDTDQHEDLYLTYNKIELQDNGRLVRRRINHRELLNPEPFYRYTPEESDVGDPANREKHLYSSKPVSFKEELLGKPISNVDGYRVFVPKKAVGDPRIYQLFRWRVKCEFTRSITVDPSRDSTVIKCGVIVTNEDLGQSIPSRAPYALLNLARSRYNASGVVFQNPAKDNHDAATQERRNYWFVNIDTDTLDDYDLLIWAPGTPRPDFSKYRGKINDFTGKHGGTIFIDTNNLNDKSLVGTTSVPFHPSTGKARLSGSPTVRGLSKTADWRNRSHPLINGNERLGGWALAESGNNDNIDVMSYSQTVRRKYTQYFETLPSEYRSLIRVDRESSGTRTVTAVRRINSGHIILSTFSHLRTCNALFSHKDNTWIHSNTGSRIANLENYNTYINGVGIEGAMKLLYNAALLGVKGRILDDSDQEQMVTSVSYYTPWRSSWVIDAGNDVLSLSEKEEHNFVIDARDIYAETPDTTPVWKRRLATRTYKELIEEVIEPFLNNPATSSRFVGAAREYTVEITNPFVDVVSKIVESEYPQAWTEAYTPRFTVPAEIGPHIIKEEIDPETGEKGRIAQYDDVTYVRRDYPEKPYGGQITSTYVATEEIAKVSGTNFVATGTAVGTTKITTTTPARTVSKTSDIDISWWESQVTTRNNAGGPTDPSGSMFYRETNQPHRGMIKPVGIETWQNANYYTNSWGPGHLCFPDWGRRNRVAQGSRGDNVRFVQDAYNRISGAGYFKTPKLTVDGVYGPATRQATRNFQTAMKARWVDGVVDAETWSLIGIQIHRLAANKKLGSINTKNWQKWYNHNVRVQLHRLSNGLTGHWIAKRSWISGGPSVIWDMYAIQFRETYNFHGITVVPYVAGDAKTMMFRSIHVRNSTNLSNYNSTSGQLTKMSHRPKDGQRLYVPFGPYRGNTLVIGVGQDKSSGWGTARMFGLRDVRGHARVSGTTEIPARTNIEYQQEDITFTVSGSVDVESFKDRVIQLQAPKWNNYHSVSNVRFTGITTNNPAVTASITTGGKATFKTQLVATNSGEEVVQGQAFPAPGFTYYSMDDNGRFNPTPETGWVSKSEGVKLLCDAKKRPIGFPDMPTGVGRNEAQRHYVKMSLGSSGTDHAVQMGFYDFAKKEFITSADGKAEISFIEYVKRGPQNIYIAVISDYEQTSDEVVPVDEDAPRLPYRWAMPVYGVCTKNGSRITLESLPDRLGPRDIWPIAVRDGRFIRDVFLRDRRKGGIAGYLGPYQGTVVKAFYALPEADLGGYSKRFGPPNADILNEEPIILDDDVIQVRQAPILMETFPTANPNKADPFRPVVTFYKRADRNSPWIEQPFSEIRDFNASTGELFLRQRLTSNDNSLLRVDYTTKRRSYHFKRDEDTILNLNSYSGHSRDLIGEAVYIYVVPHFVRDINGNLISESVQERTLRVTLDPGVFNPLDANYDPLAVQLGVVYISTALDIRNLALLDTRRRGGGIRETANAMELKRLVTDSTTFWDINDGVGSSYQKSGFIVIRLPEELKGQFSEAEIREIVGRNVTAGVSFKIESLQGEDWS